MLLVAGQRILLPLILGACLVEPAAAQDAPSPAEASLMQWKRTAAAYQITREGAHPAPLTFRDEPVLKWTNPERQTDDGVVFVWLDRGRPKVAASFYRYPLSGPSSYRHHEFVSLATTNLAAKLGSEQVWAPHAGIVGPTPIPDAPEPAKTPAERLRQMRALAREFHATLNTPPNLEEIRLLTQPVYRFELEGKRDDVRDGALFAFVHTTDPEVLLTIEARPVSSGGPIRWHYAAARMSMIQLRLTHKDREVWFAAWADSLRDPALPYFVRSVLAAP